MAKKAVLIGCNYPGTQAELKGCVNDVHRMYECLMKRYGFSPDNISVLIDTDRSYTQPTGRNIRTALSDLVRSAAPGDFLFVHYSGHGTRLPAVDDETGYDECIVPTDMNLITDDDFRELVDRVPLGCRITIVSDSCHSGGLIAAAKEQIGESTKRNKHESASGLIKNFVRRSVEDAIESRGIRIPSHHRRHHHEPLVEEYVKDKSLPLSILIEILKQKTGKEDIDEGKLRPTLFDLFGEDASPKVKKFMKIILSKLQGQNHGEGSGGGILGIVGGLALQLLEHKLEMKEEGKLGNWNSLPDSGILISGCQTDETSADASPGGDAGRAYGALSNAIQRIIGETGGRVSNREVVVRAREMLRKEGFTQRPGLYCSDDHVDAPFVC